jgi:transposase
MPAPTSTPLRQRLYQLHQSGQSTTQIAQVLDLSPRTVRHLLASWRQQLDPPDLSPRPHGRGRPLRAARLPLRQACLQLRRDHRGWGAGRIRLQLLQLYPKQSVPPRALCSAGCIRLA